MDSLQGRALVASPYLTDPNFLRSVVYILQHDAEGAIGLVLNRPLGTSIGSLLEDLEGRAFENDAPLYYGGPVEGGLMLLQEGRCADESAPAVYLATEQARITEICGSDPTVLPQPRYRLFDGYSGWAAGQLDAEMRSGGWLVWDIQPNQLFSDPEELWQLAIKQIGRDILAGGIDPAKMPKDPAYN